MELVPIAKELETARASPIYLSSTMVKLFGMPVREAGMDGHRPERFTAMHWQQDGWAVV